MNRDRFEDLASAYGGQIARWPAAERDAAALFAEAEPIFARQTLAAASALDEALEAWATPAADAALREAILAAAPAPRGQPGLAAWFWRAGVGASLAAACLAGVLVGIRLSPEPNGEDVVASAMASFDVASAEEEI